MKLTIGIPAYNNYHDVWFTVQALRMFHDLTATEIMVVDNFGCERTNGLGLPRLALIRRGCCNIII